MAKNKKEPAVTESRDKVMMRIIEKLINDIEERIVEHQTMWADDPMTLESLYRLKELYNNQSCLYVPRA
jgi:hypothetical protein